MPLMLRRTILRIYVTSTMATMATTATAHTQCIYISNSDRYCIWSGVRDFCEKEKRKHTQWSPRPEAREPRAESTNNCAPFTFLLSFHSHQRQASFSLFFKLFFSTSLCSVCRSLVALVEIELRKNINCKKERNKNKQKIELH